MPGNLNRGFYLSSGEYLTWTSDDNCFRTTAIESMVSALESNLDAGIVYASYQVIDENGRNLQILEADPNGKDHILGSNVVGACFMYTREVYEEVGDYDVDLMLVEDFDYWQRVMMKFNAIVITDVLYDYRWHDASLTSTKNEKRFGMLLERMLLKNRPGFGKLNLESAYFYYTALNRSCKLQEKKNEHILKFTLIYFCWRANRLCQKIWGK